MAKKQRLTIFILVAMVLGVGVGYMMNQFGHGLFACVMDSYDYAHALESILPSVASKHIANGGYMVLRPDSGDLIEVVLMALR